MGGNTSIIRGGVQINAQRVPLDQIGRQPFVKKLAGFVHGLNKAFKTKNGYPIWEDETEINNGGIFNGSTSFIMSPDYSDSDILKYKKSAGDADVAFPEEYADAVFDFLADNEGTEFYKDTKYIGNNRSKGKLGNTIICIVKMKFDSIIVNVQVDLELSEMKNGVQSDWSKFAHSSSFDDAKAGMKGVFSKHFWRALVGTIETVTDNFVIATPASTEDKIKLKGKQPSKIRLLNFGVDSGVGAGYELLKTKYEGKDVYREKKPAEKTYERNLEFMLNKVFGSNNIKAKDTHSFVKTLELCNKYLSKKQKQNALDRFCEILFCNDGGQCQVIELDPKEDLELKVGGYMKACELLKLKPASDIDKIAQAYKNKMFGTNESFRALLESLKK